MKKFYAVAGIGDGGDIPLFFDAEWVPELPDFDYVSYSPGANDFEKKYELTTSLDNLEVDVILEQFLASSEFVELCDLCSCSFITIPIEIKLTNSMIKDRYNFFCLTQRISILDKNNSQYELMDEKLLRPVEERPNNLPVYERIDIFVINSDVLSDLFFCEELKQVVCSENFKALFEEKSLTGLSFTSIDENFQYAPWDDF